MSDVPLREHAMLSDCASAALVTSGGSVDWLCLPRFDSPALFARLLDRDAGHFVIAPVSEEATSTWRYRPRSLVLETDWETPTGAFTTTDALALGSHEHGHELGRESPGVLLRTVVCSRGRVTVGVEFVPRPEFGLVHPRLERVRGGVLAHGGATITVLSSQVDLDLAHGRAGASVELGAGDSLAFAVEQTSTWAAPIGTWKPRRISRRIERTNTSWQSWSDLHQRYDGPLRDLVHHSGVVLQGLTFARTGAVVAAPTTSLPEGVGSGRTWDYRFSWVRDASMTLQALFLAACPDEAGRFFSFLATAAATQLDRGVELQIMFGIGGERDLSERELPHLAGWRDSGPVRVGNAAWSQRQLDVYGALLDSAYTLREQLGDLDEPTRQFLVAAVDAAAGRWEGGRPGDLGAAWTGPPVPAQQADVLGGDGPWVWRWRSCWPSTTAVWSPGRGPATRSARRSSRKGGARRQGPIPSPSAPMSSIPRCC